MRVLIISTVLLIVLVSLASAKECNGSDKCHPSATDPEINIAKRDQGKLFEL